MYKKKLNKINKWVKQKKKKKKTDEFTQNDTEIEEYRNTRISEFLDKRYIYTHGKNSTNKLLLDWIDLIRK